MARTGRGWISVQHAIAFHVEYVAALNRSDHCDAVAVYKISEDSAAAMQYRCVKEVAIERMPPISQRIAAIASAVGRIGQEEIGAVDVVLFWCVINGVRPCVGREHFKAAREAFVEREIEAIVDRLPNRLRGEDVPKSREYACGAEDRPAIGQLLSGRHKVDVSDYREAVTSCEQIGGRERQVSSNFAADRYVSIHGIQACKIRTYSRDVLDTWREALWNTGEDVGERRRERQLRNRADREERRRSVVEEGSTILICLKR